LLVPSGPHRSLTRAGATANVIDFWIDADVHQPAEDYPLLLGAPRKHAT